MKNKTLAIIGTNGLPGRYGGWDQLLNHLTIGLADQYDIVVYTSKFNAVKGLKEVNGAKLKIIPLKANGYQSVLYDGVSLFHAALQYDILLVLGTSGCIFLPFIKIFNKKIILNPDGAEWKRGKWNKYIKWFLKKSEHLGVKYANIIISDNKIIQEYITKEYNRESELIAYGGDNARYVPMTVATEERYGIKSGTYAFKVCRIEPENNIDIILEAFKDLDMQLILIGNYNFSDYGRQLKVKYKNYKNLILLDPIYEQAVLDELRGNCRIYVHGHSVGGTNPSLVEAMNLRLCCVVYNVSYNIETTENAAIYFNNVADLKAVIAQVQRNEIDETSVREKMLEIAIKRYKWDIVVREYQNLFNR